MRNTENIGFVLLGVWAIIEGVLNLGVLGGVSLPAIVGAVIALLAGVLILFGK